MNIWVPRTKILEPEFALPGLGVRGRFRITGRLDDGRTRVLADWQDNLITDYGLNLWGTASVFDRCSLGTGTAQPSVGNNALSQYARVNNSTANLSNNCATVSPYYGWYRNDYIFNPPGADLNIAEVGMGKGANGTLLWSHARIKDSGGADAILTWLAAETLTVTYEARSYRWEADVPHETIIGGVTHTGIIRPTYISNQTQSRFPNTLIRIIDPSVTNNAAAYAGTIGAITSGPSGTQASSAAPVYATYANDLKAAGSCAWGTTIANFAGGIGAVVFWATGQAFQISFDPYIQKLNTHTLTINASTGVWGRQ